MKVISKRKARIVWGKGTSLETLPISLALIRTFWTDWFKVTFLGGPEIAIKSCFVVLG